MLTMHGEPKVQVREQQRGDYPVQGDRNERVTRAGRSHLRRPLQQVGPLVGQFHKGEAVQAERI
jgi:hypothetical protein